ncbi:MAG: type II secretion system F family protein [Kineosporiaceae bacterium]
MNAADGTGTLALAALFAAAAGWTAHGPPVGLGRLRSPADVWPGLSDLALVVDLVAAALRAGLPLPLALRAVGEAAQPATHDRRRTRGPGTGAGLERLADVLATGDDVTAVAVPPGLAPLVDAVDFAARTGAPLAPLLAEVARSVRRRRREASIRAAGRLSASLVLPLGLAALPGFLLLGVAPVVVRLMTALG